MILDTDVLLGRHLCLEFQITKDFYVFLEYNLKINFPKDDQYNVNFWWQINTRNCSCPCLQLNCVGTHQMAWVLAWSGVAGQ